VQEKTDSGGDPKAAAGDFAVHEDYLRTVEFKLLQKRVIQSRASWDEAVAN
jgi:hypothetical protein